MTGEFTRNHSASNQTTRWRELVVYNDQPGEDGVPAYIGMWIKGVQIAAGVRQDDGRWSLWSPGLRLRLMATDPPVALGAGHPEPLTARPLRVDDEHDVRAWLALLADLAEHGAKVVDGRTR